MSPEKTMAASRFFALVAMTALWVSQPLLDMLGQYPEFLVAHGLDSTGIMLLAAVIAVLVPLLIASLSWLLTRLNKRFGSVVHWLLMTVLFGLMALLVLAKFEQVQGVMAIGVAVLAVIACLWVYRTFRPVQSLLAILSPVSLVFLAVFFLKPGVAVLLKPQADSNTVAPDPQQPLAPLVFIVLDELSLPLLTGADGLINAHEFPNFAALADDSHWFRNATTVSDWTSLAVPAILTGRYPVENLPPAASAYPENLFSWLGPYYRVHAYESAVRLCPADICEALSGAAPVTRHGKWYGVLRDLSVVYRYLVTPKPWVSELPNIAMRWRGFSSTETAGDHQQLTTIRDGMMFEGRMDVMRRFGQSIVSVDGPSFHYLHVLLPHTPYEYLPGGYRYPGGWTVPATDWVSWDDNPFYVDQARSRYLLQLRALDEALGQLLQTMQEQGVYEDAALVLTADHGTSFVPGERWRTAEKGTPSMSDILRVPVFIKAPGQSQGVIDDRPVETVDILPGLAQVLGLDLPWPVDGTSPFGDPVGDKAGRVFATVIDGKLASERWNPEPLKSAYRHDSLASSGSDLGKFAGHTGKSLDEFTLGIDDRWTAQLDRPESFRNIVLEHALRPSLVTGELQGEGMAPEMLAISVNGVIADVTRVYDGRESPAFAGLVNPDRFVAGMNEVRLFGIGVNEAGLTTLSEIALDNNTDRVVYRLDGDRVVELLNGIVTPLELAGIDHIQGKLSTYFASPDTLEFSGWAVDINHQLPAAGLVFFEDGRQVHIAAMEKPVPALGAALGLETTLNNPGFQVAIPRARLSRPDQPCLRLIALGHDRTYLELATRRGGWNTGCGMP